MPGRLDLAQLKRLIAQGEVDTVLTVFPDTFGRLMGKRVVGSYFLDHVVEDGAHACAESTLFNMTHLGCVVPPNADTYWVGDAGPGPSYLDPDSGGPDNDFTNRNTTFMTWNLLHLARMLKDAGGMPAHGNQRSLWDAGCRFDFANPDYR